MLMMMFKAIFIVTGVICLFASVSMFEWAKSAVHEIEALIFLLIAVVSFIGVSILEALAKPKIEVAAKWNQALPSQPTGGGSVKETTSTQLERLVALRDRGVLTEEEFIRAAAGLREE